ncbi:NAD kinase [Eisenibacter elegans]|jgi:NAD+ kinase|uniref:NAD kinase n=1 Tax=Eisenibacter elegans TaxID=997 RepID=UPI0003F5BDE2|nr:NAD kinase [Eisenibacter elegans]
MKIAINGRAFKPEVVPYVVLVFEELQKRQAEVHVSQTLHRFLTEHELNVPFHHVYKGRGDLEPMDFIFSLGGDGTLLDSITHVAERETPILGINMGRLGFLATTSPKQIPAAIDHLFKGFYQIDARVLIHVDTSQDVFEGLNFGLNDFTITKRDTASMIVVHTYINGEYLNSYWADGLIVSTPTGSTAYSLSCGGPVVLPASNNFILSPVSPHNLNVRPLVISDDSVVAFEVEGRSKNFLVSLDSRFKIIDAGIQLAVRKEKFKAHIVKFADDNFLGTLRNKLNWGMDVRNYIR